MTLLTRGKKGQAALEFCASLLAALIIFQLFVSVQTSASGKLATVLEKIKMQGTASKIALVCDFTYFHGKSAALNFSTNVTGLSTNGNNLTITQNSSSASAACLSPTVSLGETIIAEGIPKWF